MDGASVQMYMSNALAQFMILALPPLGAALVAGLVVGLLQAVTQIQDQTMPQTVKLLVVIAVLALFAPVLSAPLFAGAAQVFTDFPSLTRRG
ncbi:EscS/YscS/HrcS family type III secretion system export apparatus protein [Methylobacterium sp. J-076]|uniref:EscS/YscS/HrcS family type III secretion system export apparatus protein n=1 Tax=Methylobacterium sp. J-076 TaxID=2836655 RepID=UPI001FBA8B75|nr:flagellar biosynthetic protein FliQ [Methylobacterium sp. J-076]MCJ2013132.1 flagellar biosynthetic protein FliQ [Methylobacterium sp. J-076]